MPNDGKKGITVKINAELHAEIKEYIESHGMTMAEFVILALDDELHPKFDQKEGQNMGNMRTLAFQMPEDLFQRIKEYLQRNNMTQKEFVIGLIEAELERDQLERENAEQIREESEEDTEQEESTAVSNFEAVSKEVENSAGEQDCGDCSEGFEDENEESESEDEDEIYDEYEESECDTEDESETSGMGFSMGM